MKEKNKYSTRRSIATLLATAVLCLSSLISIDMGTSANLTFVNFFAILFGAVFGGIQGAGAAGLYVVLGCTGLNIFPEHNGGVSYLSGPYGGILIGYFGAAICSGLILGTPHSFEGKQLKDILKIALATLAGYFVVYVISVPWFIQSVMANTEDQFHGYFQNLSLLERIQAAIEMLVTQYVMTDLIKLIVTSVIALFLRPSVGKFLYRDDETEQQEMMDEMKTKFEKRNQRKNKFMKK